MKRSIYSFVQDGRAECNLILDRLTNSDNMKSSRLCMPKKVRKGLGRSLYVNSTEKVNHFCVISTRSSENSSGIKVGSVCNFRETVGPMISNTMSGERRITDSFEKHMCIAQT